MSTTTSSATPPALLDGSGTRPEQRYAGPMTPPVVASGTNATDIAARVTAAFARIAEVDRPEVWITLRPVDDVHADARAVTRRLADGEPLPLAGALLAVKDNIDVAGLPTTAACPAFAYVPTKTATAVRRLTAAGALVLGNL